MTTESKTREYAEAAVADRADLLTRAIVSAADEAEEAVAANDDAIVAAVRNELIERAMAGKTLKASFGLSITVDLDNDPPQIGVAVRFGKAQKRHHVAPIESAGPMLPGIKEGPTC